MREGGIICASRLLRLMQLVTPSMQVTALMAPQR